MKIKNIISLAFVMMGFVVTSCEYDNYDAPSYRFSGQLTCDGENFEFDANKSIFRLAQEGYGKPDLGIDMRTDDNGRFQQLLFKAPYKLTLANNPYPFDVEGFSSLGTGLGYDSIQYDISSNIVRNFEVTPYYKLSNLTVALDGKKIVAKFSVTKNKDTAPIVKRAYIYLGTASLVNSNNKCQSSTKTSATEISVSIPLASYRQDYVNNFREYAYCRVAVELDGIPDFYLFSKTMRIDGLPVN